MITPTSFSARNEPNASRKSVPKRTLRIAAVLRSSVARMDLIQIYQCFCDRTRLRILHLLTHSRLCVCHLQDILGEHQVKVSKHLAYLRRKGLVTTARQQNWIIYSLPKRAPLELQRNLKCLQDCVQTDSVFKRDLVKLTTLQKTCCQPTSLFGKRMTARKINDKEKSSVHLRA